MHNTEMRQLNWKFKPSYAQLPDIFFAQVKPEPVSNPTLVIINQTLSETLNLSLPKSRTKNEDHYLAQLFSGQDIPNNAELIAQAYAGHQFGHFTMLGDGRAILLGEHVVDKHTRLDIQFKGSGRTPYSRGGDGRAALAPMLREYLISEAMHTLKIPTTRSLAVVTTGEHVYRETPLPGAILTRVASSHLRVGTFEFAKMQHDPNCLKKLLNYSLERHAPHLKASQNPALDFLNHVIQKQCALVVEWMRVGFVHGVMNTDNMTISGETIDYGPCAFMDAYHENTVFSAIDRHGRYAYGQQPRIAQWNLACLAETLLPMIHQDQAHELAKQAIHAFTPLFETAWLKMMRQKLGLFNDEDDDQNLIKNLLSWMQNHRLDYTYTFAMLSDDQWVNSKKQADQIYQSVEFKSWYAQWQARLKRQEQSWQDSQKCMQQNNPYVIPRNHWVENALQAAQENNDLSQFEDLHRQLRTPYSIHNKPEALLNPPTKDQQVYTTYCGT